MSHICRFFTDVLLQLLLFKTVKMTELRTYHYVNTFSLTWIHLTGRRPPLQDPPSLRCRLWLSLTTITPRCGVWAGTSPAPCWPLPGMTAVFASGKVGAYCYCLAFILLTAILKGVFVHLCNISFQICINNDSCQVLSNSGWCIVGIRKINFNNRFSKHLSCSVDCCS